MSRMVVGLGNPGPEYESTRHNAGFWVVNILGGNLRVPYWKDEAGARVGTARVGDEEIVLAQPQAFMNVSGGAVARLAERYGAQIADILVIHDDIDLPPGAVRVKRDGGHGGHNGLRSIHERLGSGGYPRVRVGVGRPPGRMDPADFVLRELRSEELEELEATCTVAAQAVMHVLEHGVDSAMREYNSD